jgi:hypothetical protein
MMSVPFARLKRLAPIPCQQVDNTGFELFLRDIVVLQGNIRSATKVS